MSIDSPMSEQKPVNPIKRSHPDESPARISSMAQRRRPSVSNKVFFFLLLAGAGIVLGLWLSGVIQLPAVQKTPTQTPTISTTTMVQKTSQDAKFTPTQTLTPSLTPTSTVTPTATPTPTATATEIPKPFVLKGTPQPVSSKMIHPSWGCEYLVIGGQVWDLQDAPVIGKTVHLGGSYGDELISLFVLTGDDTVYGESGYEFVLENKRINSSGSLWIRLEDEIGLPLSGITYLDISDSCQQNLILVNFKQVR